MPRGDFDVITGPTAPSRPIPPASLLPEPEASRPSAPERPSRAFDTTPAQQHGTTRI